MKHFTIQLVDAGKQTRQWSIWANTLTVGSDPRSKLVLPAPAAAHVCAFRADGAVELPFGHLIVHEDTSLHSRMWDAARARIAKSRLLAWSEPGEKGRNARAAVIATLGAMAFFLMGAMYIIGDRPVRAGESELPASIIDLVPIDETKLDPPKPVEPEPVEPIESGADKPIADPNQGGPTEARTVAQPPNSPAGVMAGSVLARANTDMGDLLGSQVDPNASNMIDVIIAGPGGLRGSNQNGRAGDGDNRMVGIGGAGLGSGGRAGFGTGRGSISGTMRAGLNTHGDRGVAMRPTIAAPKPTDVDIGGEIGSRSPESILRVIRSNIGGFRYSYEKVLRENPDIGGKIAMKFTIAPSGDIVAIEIVSSSTGVESLDAEIKEKARRMKFDSIEKGNVTVTYAFVLDRQ